MIDYNDKKYIIRVLEEEKNRIIGNRNGIKFHLQYKKSLSLSQEIDKDNKVIKELTKEIEYIDSIINKLL